MRSRIFTALALSVGGLVSVLLAEEPALPPEPTAALPAFEEHRPVTVSHLEHPQLGEFVPVELRQWFEEGSFQFFGSRLNKSAAADETAPSGAALLERAQSTWDRFPLSEFLVAIHERSDKRPDRARDLRLTFSRLKNAPAQRFRELTEFSEPAFLVGYNWLTYRFPGPEEDLVWISSPAIGKLREISASNRSDYMLGLQLALNDLLLVSEKESGWTFKQPEQMVRFAPVADAPDAPAVRNVEGCLELAAAAGTESAWNFESRRLLNGPGWLPSAVVFVPKPLWRVEGYAQDAFGSASSMTIYFDAASGAPVYKFVRNRDGTLRAAVFGLFGAGREPGKDTALPRPIWTLVVSGTGDRATLLNYERVRYCEKVGAEVMARFEPKALVPTAVVAAAVTANGS